MLRKMMLVGFSTLCLASSLFAVDEYMPVPYRVMQIHTGFEGGMVPGIYNNNWKSTGPSGDDSLTIPMEGKFGLMDQVEGSMDIKYVLQDRSGKAGLDRPTLGLKYGDTTMGLGGFLAVSLPLGFSDIMYGGDFATMTGGVMYDRAFSQLTLYSNVSYSYNTEDNDNNKRDNVRLFVKPEYPLPFSFLATHKQYLGLNVAATYQYDFNETVIGKSANTTQDLLILAPGIYYTMNKFFSLEIAAPITTVGKNQDESRSIRAQLFFTLDEGLYNSI